MEEETEIYTGTPMGVCEFCAFTEVPAGQHWSDDCTAEVECAICSDDIFPGDTVYTIMSDARYVNKVVA